MKILKNIYSNLTKTSETEHLSKLILVLIIILDVFVFILISNGISANLNQITKRHEYVPALCQNIIIDHEIIGKIDDKIQYLVLEYNNRGMFNYYNTTNKELSDKAHPICKKYYNIIQKLITDDQNIVKLFTERRNLNSEYNFVKQDINRLSVPNISPNDVSNSITTAIKEKYNRLDIIHSKIQEIDKQISSDQNILSLRQLVNSSSQSDRETLIADLREFNFWYGIKLLFIKLAFLLPILVIFYLWFVHNIKQNKPLQKIVSSHLLIVVSIPILLEILNIIYDILPKTLFLKILTILSTLKLIALYHYLIIALSIIAFILLVNFLQRKFFGIKNIAQKRLAKNSCLYCAIKFPPNHHIKYCFNCGENQYMQCEKCNNETYRESQFCCNCGKKT